MCVLTTDQPGFFENYSVRVKIEVLVCTRALFMSL